MARPWAAAYPLARDAVRLFIRVRASRLGAALAFYVSLSLAPLLLVLVGVAGLAFGDEAARAEVSAQVRDAAGPDGAKVVETLLAGSRSPRGGILATVVGLVVLVFGATAAFAQMHDALNAVWELPEPPGDPWGVLAYVRARLLSLSVVAGLALLLLASLASHAVLAGLDAWLRARVGDELAGVGSANAAMSFVLAASMFALVFQVLPDRRVRWKDAAAGAIVTAALFSLGKYLIGLYLGTAAVASPFGAAGSFVALLVWVYYSSQILLLGAAFTRAYSERYGGGDGKTVPPAAAPAS